MIEITVTDRDGGVHRVNAREGVSLMETLRELEYGVAAICGGMCSCATCHVYVAEPWRPGHFGNRSKVVFTARDGTTEETGFPALDPYDYEVAAMEACVLDGAEPVVPLSLSREFVRTILAMYRSADSGAVERP